VVRTLNKWALGIDSVSPCARRMVFEAIPKPPARIAVSATIWFVGWGRGLMFHLVTLIRLPYLLSRRSSTDGLMQTRDPSKHRRHSGVSPSHFLRLFLPSRHRGRSARCYGRLLWRSRLACQAAILGPEAGLRSSCHGVGKDSGVTGSICA
jgi:hypothetical protein